MNNKIVIKNREPQQITINGGGEVIGITTVLVNGIDVTEGSVAYVIVPTKTSELINDSGFITQETDPTIPYYIKQITQGDINTWNNKQEQLVSGVNIKTVNDNSLLGSGNIDISTSYTAGYGININASNEISNTITSYNDLTDLPTIPTSTSELINDSDFVTSNELSDVAFSGSYADLSNIPEIPDSTSELINDSGFIDMNLLWNLFPKSTGSGVSINLTNTVKNTPLYLTLGATQLTQHGTPTPTSPQDIHTISGSNKVVVCGKNLFDKDNTVQGYLRNSNGTINPEAGSHTSNFIIIEPNTNYVRTTSEGNAYYDKNETFISYYYGKTITTPNNAKYLRMTVIDNKLNDEQLEKGSTATTYTPYVSQEADIDLGDIEYCKIGTYEDEFMIPSGSNVFNTREQGTHDEGVTTNVINDNNVIISYNGTSSSYKRARFIVYGLEKNTTYTFKANITNSNSNVTSNWLAVKNITDTAIIFNNSYTSDSEVSFNTGDNESVILVLYAIGNTSVTTNNANWNYIQLNKSTTALPYEPYNNGKWYIKKNIGKVVLDGSESWSSFKVETTSGLGRAISTLSDIKLNATRLMVMSDKLQSANYAGSWDLTYDNIAVVSNAHQIIVYLQNITTLTDFQNWIETNTPKLYYVLDTPTYTPITGTLAEQLETIYKDLTPETEQTNISQINEDLPFTISATTLKSLSSL